MRAKDEELKKNIQSGNLTAVKAVLSDSPEVITFVDEDGDTALMMASKFHYLQNKPIDLRGDFSGTQTESTTKGNDYLEIVKTLVKASTNINAKRLGKTMLMDATLYGYLATVKELIRANIDINAHDTQSETALMIAARNGEIEIVEELIKAKAGLNFININGETALMMAVQNGHVDIVKELITAKADLNLKDSNGETALMKAAKIGWCNISSVI